MSDEPKTEKPAAAPEAIDPKEVRGLAAYVRFAGSILSRWKGDCRNHEDENGLCRPGS